VKKNIGARYQVIEELDVLAGVPIHSNAGLSRREQSALRPFPFVELDRVHRLYKHDSRAGVGK
jgi:hypothetical protein